MADKKDRRAWSVDTALKTLSCRMIGLSVNLTKLTEDARVFLYLYGLKQFLSDSIASFGAGYNNVERVAKCEAKFATLCNPSCSLDITGTGTFHWKDPNKVIIKESKLEKELAKEKKALVALDNSIKAVKVALTAAEMPKEFIEAQASKVTEDGVTRKELLKLIELKKALVAAEKETATEEDKPETKLRKKDS